MYCCKTCYTTTHATTDAYATEAYGTDAYGRAQRHTADIPGGRCGVVDEGKLGGE